MSDSYGIPNNMFGTVPEEFFGQIGRITMFAALLEYRLLALLWAMDNQSPPGRYAGKSGKDVIRECRKTLEGYSRAAQDAGEDLLDRAAAVLDERHGIAHSLWPSPRLVEVFSEPGRY